jgi:hypothetical protein
MSLHHHYCCLLVGGGSGGGSNLDDDDDDEASCIKLSRFVFDAVHLAKVNLNSLELSAELDEYEGEDVGVKY